jgi:hypothetical protein
LTEVFGKSLDRKTLWERIGNGFLSCAAKCGGSVERFMNELCVYVNGSPSDVAENYSLREWLKYAETLNPEEQLLFIRTCEERRFIIVAKAQTKRWKHEKDMGAL